jgi:hypothetical protein
MHFRLERFGRWLKVFGLREATSAKIFLERPDKPLSARTKIDPQHGFADHARVMLRLRFRYVSKAAILTVPAPLVSVENRSPA